jgi:hypothetical protein
MMVSLGMMAGGPVALENGTVVACEATTGTLACTVRLSLQLLERGYHKNVESLWPRRELQQSSGPLFGLLQGKRVPAVSNRRAYD